MKKGFTLLELLVGITIFAIAVASVYCSLYLGIKVFKQENSYDHVLQEAVISLEEVSKRLRGAFINPDNEQIKFIGQDQQLDFFTVNEEGELEKISFYLEPGAANGPFSFYQTRCKVVQIYKGESPKIELINSKVASLKFSYFDLQEKVWYENWPEESKLPGMVKLEISFQSKQTQGNTVDLVKYINIPVGREINFNEDAIF